MSCLILFAEVGCRSFAPPLSITIKRGNEPLSWYQNNYIHGIEVGAPVTNKSSNQVKRIISQHSSVRQISCLVQSLPVGDRQSSHGRPTSSWRRNYTQLKWLPCLPVSLATFTNRFYIVWIYRCEQNTVDQRII